MQLLTEYEKQIYKKVSGVNAPFCFVIPWPWWFKFEGRAILFFIFLKDVNNLPIKMHEVHHVAQLRRDPITFLFKYLWEYDQVGYYNNRYEVAARLVESKVRLHYKYKVN